ncbi:peptidase of plants and bacteria-domain-containing protein [Corynascus novoguineensis]|uniref:Peptidase of plants and bacteria-domain-containing protein n=1 Tax=Corynascus novoguineensis TaxID=1126955 RepID=A0AAN7HUS4_9PEZI|nr:peptidase of plants and bacteria-domain-containing protein [Corynascus novoguineensis]
MASTDRASGHSSSSAGRAVTTTTTYSGPAPPMPSPVPFRDLARDTAESSPDPRIESAIANTQSFPQPKLRLKIQDLGHSGATKFLAAVNPAAVLSTAVDNVLRLLYKSPSETDTTVPPTRSVTLILRDMGGVAYTTGTALDNDHKEIHFSLAYINSISPPSRLTDEITGVLTHELVHCYQWNAHGTCPGGLIEGVADWVRLKCDLGPPHWKKETTGDWDRGYQHTAYFLQYLEGRFGEGTIRQLNDKLRQHKYKAETFWLELLGESVIKLYDDYVKSEEGGNKDNE